MECRALCVHSSPPHSLSLLSMQYNGCDDYCSRFHVCPVFTIFMLCIYLVGNGPSAGDKENIETKDGEGRNVASYGLTLHG